MGDQPADTFGHISNLRSLAEQNPGTVGLYLLRVADDLNRMADAQAATIATLTAERDEARAVVAAASEYVERHVYLPGIPSAMERVLTPAQAAEYRARRIAASALREILGSKR